MATELDMKLSDLIHAPSVVPELKSTDRSGVIRELVQSLADHGMLDKAHDFLMASGKLQVECYKQEIEALLRTADMGGFQLLDLHDYPGQGTALVGPLNVF